MNNTKKIRLIPGGWRAYREAVDAAYSGSCHDPCVRWSLARGFRAESYLTPTDDDQITIGLANYDAGTGNRYLPATRSAYYRARAKAITFQNALARGECRGESSY